MLNKGQLVARLVEMGAGDRRHVNNMLQCLADVAAEEIEAGNDFTVPGVARLTYRFRPARKKGERYKKGDTVSGPQGERVADADSPAQKARIRLTAQPTGAVARLKPGTKPEAQAEFLKSKAGRTVARRKSTS